MGKRVRQKRFCFPSKWGGRRSGSGRKPKGERAGTPHKKRMQFERPSPLHVTVRLKDGLPWLRREREFAVIREAFKRCCERGSFRLVHYSVQGNHMHFIVEARERADVSSGMNGLLSCVARRLNKLWKRRGKVFESRYHDRVLKTPREVRNVLRYVFGNTLKHGGGIPAGSPDRFSSAPYFRGWGDWRMGRFFPDWIVEAKTWLLSIGWSRAGPLFVNSP